MNSLFDIQSEVESFMQKHLESSGKNLWEKLVESSVNFNGTVCNGIMINEVENYTKKLLSELNDKKMYKIWKETENGIMAIKQGFDKPDRLEMIHDIVLDVTQLIGDNICLEAQKILKKKKNA